ncbi:2-oxoglutarate dehydrogenase, mitochondrial-like protein [Tanacetum coccineum]
MQDENILVTEITDQNGVQVDMSPDESNARSAPDSPVSAEAQESKSSNFVDQNIYRLEAILEPSMADLSQVGSHDHLPGFNMLPQLAPINIEESLPLPPIQWRMGKLQNTSMSTTMPDGGLHGFSNFPSPFPPIETPPPLDQNENITYEKSDNGYEDMESSSNELPTEPKIEEVVERIVPQPPSDTEPSVNTEEVAERIVPQPPSDKERPVYVFLTEREFISPSSSLPLVPKGLYSNSDVVVDIICYRRLGHNEIDEPSFTQPKMYKVIRNHPSALEIYQKKLLVTSQATKEDIDQIQNKVTSILNDEFLACKDYVTSKMDWLSAYWTGYSDIFCRVKPEILKNVGKAIATLPETFKPHKAVKKAQSIGKAASNFIQDDLKMDKVYDYLLHLLTEYSKLLKYNSTIPKKAVELYSESMACSSQGFEKDFMMAYLHYSFTSTNSLSYYQTLSKMLCRYIAALCLLAFIKYGRAMEFRRKVSQRNRTNLQYKSLNQSPSKDASFRQCAASDEDSCNTS